MMLNISTLLYSHHHHLSHHSSFCKIETWTSFEGRDSQTSWQMMDIWSDIINITFLNKMSQPLGYGHYFCWTGLLERTQDCWTRGYMFRFSSRTASCLRTLSCYPKAHKGFPLHIARNCYQRSLKSWKHSVGSRSHSWCIDRQRILKPKYILAVKAAVAEARPGAEGRWLPQGTAPSGYDME